MFLSELSAADWKRKMGRPNCISWPWEFLLWVPSCHLRRRSTLNWMPRKPYRDRRLGSQSLELIFGAASSHKKLKISHIYLHVQTSNGEAKRFYERHGFKEVGWVTVTTTQSWRSTNGAVFTKTTTRKSSPATLGYCRDSCRVKRARSNGRMKCWSWRALDVSNSWTHFQLESTEY